MGEYNDNQCVFSVSLRLAFLDNVLELDINKSYNLSQDRVFK